ncbi:lysophospholipid acyltransferase family protein [Allonocardiopsis opalescens]|uniref:lysophospholipid acyltransferase family protein n=1 Tax=Allonocardiopsis opalescens TaxID=1144618 RepID=UPI000D05F70F|nr:lysophospholipid acyltransferase family protein [Allonocardiopsis opalescens]
MYTAARAVLRPLVWLLWKPRVSGREHVPAHGAAILAGNHLSLLDPLFAGVALPRRLTFVTKAEFFAGGNPAQRAVAWFLRAIGQLSISRGAGRGASDALADSLAVLKDGELFGIYPEGTRSRDGRLYRGRTGIAYLALTAGVPVVPMAVVGTDRIVRRGRILPSLHRVGVRFGPPVDLSAWAGQADKARARRAATDAIMDAIGALSGQERAPGYAPAPPEPPTTRTV